MKDSAPASPTATKPLSLDTLLEMRKTLKALELAVINAKHYVEEQGEKEIPEVWSSFNVDRRKITLPTDMLVELLKEVSARATKEIGDIQQKFKDWGVDPCYFVDES